MFWPFWIEIVVVIYVVTKMTSPFWMMIHVVVAAAAVVAEVDVSAALLLTSVRLFAIHR